MKFRIGGDPRAHEKSFSRAASGLGRWCAGACLFLTMSGCSPGQSKGEPLKRAQLRLQTPVAAFGFDESSGNTVTDASGNGHNTTLSGQTRVAGKYGNALDFDENFVTVADSNLLDLTNGMTLAAWVRPDDLEAWWTLCRLQRRSGRRGLRPHADGPCFRWAGRESSFLPPTMPRPASTKKRRM